MSGGQQMANRRILRNEEAVLIELTPDQIRQLEATIWSRQGLRTRRVRRTRELVAGNHTIHGCPS
jgi:hypothetical protein